MEQTIMELILGPTGAGAVVAMIMGAIKKVWKPDPRELYWIPAVLISAAAAFGILWYLEFFNLWVFFLMTGIIAAFELLTQNEAWPAIKSVILAIFGKLIKR